MSDTPYVSPENDFLFDPKKDSFSQADVDSGTASFAIDLNVDTLDELSQVVHQVDPETKKPGTVVQDENGNATLEAQLLRYLVDPDLDTYQDNRRVILKSFAPAAFRDELYVLYSILHKFRDKNLVPDEEFIQIYLSRNIAELVEANRKYIDLSEYSDLAQTVDSSAIVGDISDKALLYAGAVVAYYRDLVKLPEPPVSLQETNLLVEKYKMEFSALAAEQILRKGMTILTSGLQEGRKFHAGFSDAQDYVRRGLSGVDGIVDQSQGTGHVSYADLLNSTEEAPEVYQVGDYGTIRELNQHFGGIFSQSLITVAAPNKGGKTKFCLSTIYEAVTKYQQNVTIWPVEGSIAECMAELQAIHFDRMTNGGRSPENSKLGVDKYTILHKKWDVPGFRHPDWQKQCELLALDLGTNPKYGRIDFVDRPLLMETLTDELDVSVKSNGSSLVFIDYLMLTRSRDGRLKRHEILERVYPEVLNYVKRNNLTLLSPAQFTQEAIKALAKGSESGSDEMRTSLGGSSEITRSSDITIALWASTRDLAEGHMKIMSIPSRVARPFEPFEIITDLGSCTFMSQS